MTRSFARCLHNRVICCVKLHITCSKDQANEFYNVDIVVLVAGLAILEKLSGELPFSDPDGLIA